MQKVETHKKISFHRLPVYFVCFRLEALTKDDTEKRKLYLPGNEV